MNNLRNRTFDIAKGIGILLVVIGHVISRESIPGRAIYAFHMPLFFFISGYCTNYNVTLGEFVEKKYQQLLIPCLSFVAICSIVEYYLLGNEDAFQSLSYQLPNALWFLPILFISSVLFFLLWTRCNSRLIIVLAFVVLIMLCPLRFASPNMPYRLNYLTFAIFFLMLGHVYRAILSGYHLPKPYIRILYVLSLLFFIIAVYIMIPHSTSPIELAFSYLISAVNGTLIVMFFSSLLKKKSRKLGKFIEYLGRNTLVILAIHFLALHFSLIYIHPYIKNFILYKLIESVVIWTVCLGCIELVNRKLPFLIGRKG